MGYNTNYTLTWKSQKPQITVKCESCGNVLAQEKAEVVQETLEQ